MAVLALAALVVVLLPLAAARATEASALQIVAPDQYRGRILDMIAEDARAIASRFGPQQQVEAHVRALLEVPLPVESEPPVPVLPTNIRRFFREYFGHPKAPFVFKNGGDLPREAVYIYYGPGSFPVSMDDTIALLYQEDQDFLSRMLSTREFSIRIGRDGGRVRDLLGELRRAADDPGANLMPPIEEAVRARHAGHGGTPRSANGSGGSVRDCRIISSRSRRKSR